LSLHFLHFCYSRQKIPPEAICRSKVAKLFLLKPFRDETRLKNCRKTAMKVNAEASGVNLLGAFAVVACGVNENRGRTREFEAPQRAVGRVSFC
jgi:hypothetical protein